MNPCIGIDVRNFDGDSVVANHFDCICQATSDSIPAVVVVSEDVRYQCTEQFNQCSTQSFPMKILNIKILIQFTEQNFDQPPDGVDQRYIQRIVGCWWQCREISVDLLIVSIVTVRIADGDAAKPLFSPP